MNTQPNLAESNEPTEPPTCVRCDEPGTSFLVEVGEQGSGMWLCARHLARLQAHADTVPELDGMFDGALVITEIKAAEIGEGQGGKL